MNKSYKYRIYPTKKQTTSLKKMLEVCRKLYNNLLEERINFYKINKKSLGYYEQKRNITQQKKTKSELKEINAQVLQNVAMRVDLAFQGFFRRLKIKGQKPGFPRFKGFNRYDSFTYTQNNGSFKFLDNGKIRLSKVGHTKIIKHRELEGVPKTCIVKRQNDKWYIVISCVDVPKKPLSKTNKEVGIDLGLSNFATLSDGVRINNPRFFKEEENKLAKSQKKLSKLKKNTPERKRQIKIVRRIYERISNKRRNFEHQLSHKMVKEYDVICVEDLNINKMKESGKYKRLNKSIQDVAWGNFLNKLPYKAEDAGKVILKVNPAYTSQTCSKCNAVQKLLLSDRIFNCKTCGNVLDRDLNASINIKRLGLQSFGVGKTTS